MSFKYDPFGRRIYKSSSAGTSIYAYDAINLVEETNSSGSVVSRFAQGDDVDEALAMLRIGATSFLHSNGVSSVTSLSNSAGSLAQTYAYDSFGMQTASPGSLTNPFRYTGREWDTETSLQFSRARYFHNSTARFLSEDPVGFKGGVNFGAVRVSGLPAVAGDGNVAAINRVIDKINSDPCCVDPGLRKRLLGFLSGGNNGSGVTFVYHSHLSAGCGVVGDPLARYKNIRRFFANRVEIG